MTGEIDLTLHVDPATGKPSAEANVLKEIVKGVEADVDVQVDQDGKPTVSVGVKIPF